MRDETSDWIVDDELGAGLWHLVETELGGDRVVYSHGVHGDPSPVATILLSPGAAAGLGSALISYALELEPDVARAAVLRVLLG